MQDLTELKKVIDLLRGAKTRVESARICAPVPLALCLDLATVAISLQRDIAKIEQVIQAMEKDAQEITIIIAKTSDKIK